MTGSGSSVHNNRPNIHATCVVLGDRGILITGGSGTGKTALALRLLDSARKSGKFARLVADDQLLIFDISGKIVCRAPSAIAGLVEMRGVGVVPIEFEPAAVVHLRVRLCPAAEINRIPELGEASFRVGLASVISVDLPEKMAGDNEIAILRVMDGMENGADNSFA
jgi:serine kinase of HPr protein (carbohydrate metabolism regulator)